jgi:hypothetical protein
MRCTISHLRYSLGLDLATCDVIAGAILIVVEFDQVIADDDYVKLHRLQGICEGTSSSGTLTCSRSI